MHSHLHRSTRHKIRSGISSGWWLAFTLAMHLVALPLATLEAASRKAGMADAVADLVGVNTHISYRGTVYDTGSTRSYCRVCSSSASDISATIRVNRTMRR